MLYSIINKESDTRLLLLRHTTAVICFKARRLQLQSRQRCDHSSCFNTLANMGCCCSCFDGIRGGRHGNADGNEKATEMTSARNAANVDKLTPRLGISRAMSAPTIGIQGFKVCVSDFSFFCVEPICIAFIFNRVFLLTKLIKVSGSGLALATIPIEQDGKIFPTQFLSL